MKLITPAHGPITLSASQNPELFSIAKCGLGALGVVSELTIQCVRRHKLICKTFVLSHDELRRRHMELLSEYQHTRYMWLPHTKSVVVVTCNPITEAEAKAYLAANPLPSAEEEAAHNRAALEPMCKLLKEGLKKKVGENG
jgi:L-galactono-1,4-lactone dehydrogenase